MDISDQGRSVGLFRPYQQGQTETAKASDRDTAEHSPRASEPGRDADNQVAKGQGDKGLDANGQTVVTRRRGPQRKSGPTPSRAEAEAARMARLHPNLSRRELRRRDRDARRQARITGLENMEKKPERILIRDYIDSRRTFSEFIMPIFLGVMILWFIIITIFPKAIVVVNLMTVLMLAVMVGWAVDAWRLWRPIRRQLISEYPETSRKGMLSYMNNRAMTPRRWRNPAPRVAPASRKKA